MVLPADQIWMPEIAMMNSMDQGYDLTLDTHFRYVHFVQFEVPLYFKSLCPSMLVSQALTSVLFFQSKDTPPRPSDLGTYLQVGNIL